jgi:hypothetical protein
MNMPSKVANETDDVGDNEREGEIRSDGKKQRQGVEASRESPKPRRQSFSRSVSQYGLAFI